jgi:aromatic-L-amino-acid/L-tryptophan decarboxylase
MSANDERHSVFTRSDAPARNSVAARGDLLTIETYAAAVGEMASRGLGTGDLDEFRSAGHALIDAVADHLEGLPDGPVWRPLPDGLRTALLELPLPDGPTGLDVLGETMTADVLPHAMGNGHPAFFGWVNSPPALAGVLASLVAAAMNPSVVTGDHADVHLERTVVRWLAELVGYPHAPGAGLLTSGASAATIVCLAGARSRACSAAGRDVRRAGLVSGPRLVAYVPSEAHSCVPRALELLGFGTDCIRPVPLAGGHLDGDALRVSIAADRAAGATPALLVGSAGTVNSGAIDPLDALAEIAAAERLWFHVDGAYGAFGVLDPALAVRYRGMERADSLTLDPHKWLGVPVDAGCVLVRRAADLRDAFSVVPPYLRQGAGAEVGTFAEYGLEQTRPFRALKTWATLAARGRNGAVEQIIRATALARELAGLVEAEPTLELACPPQTSIVAFRAQPEHCSPERVEAVNRVLPEAVQARGRAFVTGTVYDGRETLRACILHPGTTESDLATLVAEVVSAAAELAAAVD